MIHSLSMIRATRTDPRENLAVEEYLLRRVRPGQCILYLWQNQRTVVIGRNQQAENECRIRKLEADGGHLVRRLSGGGAVYHDLGNLNFTFLVQKDDFDVKKQTEVILRAVQMAGIQAEKNGRNDLTIAGQKFSGHAYYRTGNQCYHHGTLMVAVDVAPLAEYLMVSPLKLQAKGVKSVRSRVVNLREFCPDLTIELLCQYLTEAFSQVYDLPVQELAVEHLDQEALAEGKTRFSDPDWIYGDCRPLEVSREAKFDWGVLRLDFTPENGVIREVSLWSDGLEADFLSRIPELLRDCPLEENALRQRLSWDPAAAPHVIDSVIALLIQRIEETP